MTRSETAANPIAAESAPRPASTHPKNNDSTVCVSSVFIAASRGLEHLAGFPKPRPWDVRCHEMIRLGLTTRGRGHLGRPHCPVETGVQRGGDRPGEATNPRLCGIVEGVGGAGAQRRPG